MKKQRFIEAHVHMDAWDQRTKNYVKNCGTEQFWVMDTHNEKVDKPRHVKKAVMLKAAKEMPNRIIPFAMIDWTDNSDQVKKFFKAGFVGLKAIVPPKPYNHLDYLPIYEQASKFQMPILFHTGIIAHSQEKKKYTDLRGYGPSNMEPAFLATIADMNPDLTIIGGHPGFPYTEQTEHNLYYYPNIYHDISGYLSIEWLLQVLNKRTCSYLNGPKMFIEKLLFATDHCIGNKSSEEWGIQKRDGLNSCMNIFGNKYIWWEYLDNLWYKNANRIMTKILKTQKRIRKKNFLIR